VLRAAKASGSPVSSFVSAHSADRLSARTSGAAMATGKTFKEPDSDERHRYGQHYTPREVARLLAAFAVRSAGDLVLDPSCGDGRLLAEALERKARLVEQSHCARDLLCGDLYGLDRSAPAVEAATATGARVAQADFFDVEPGSSLNEALKLPERFDAIIGNPPYIRQEVMGAPDKLRVVGRLTHDRAQAAEVWWPRWSGRSDIYVFFFAHAIRFLKPGGRLVFLTASSWLDVGYGAPLREFLLRNFRIVAVIESAVETFFSDASINTAITVLERKPGTRAGEDQPVRFVQLTAPLAEIFRDREAGPVELSREIGLAHSARSSDEWRIRLISQSSLVSEGGWGRHLRADDVFFRVLDRGRTLLPLGELARVRFGLKSGANDFFYLKEAGDGNRARATTAGPGGLSALGDVASLRRGITTGANEFFYVKAVDARCEASDEFATLLLVEDGSGKRHAIESRYLSPVIFSLKELAGVWLDRIQTARMIFSCSETREALAGTRALDYIQEGERQGYDRRPTCASRKPWYSVARGLKPAPMIFPSKVGERWLVAINRARVFEDKKLYGVFPRGGVSTMLLAALLNSTWARYYTEATCRQMTGAQAIADIDVAVAEQILLPDPRAIPTALVAQLEAAVERLAARPIVSVFEEIEKDDRRRLDELVLEAIGFAAPDERLDVLDQLYSAASALVRRRLARSRR